MENHNNTNGVDRLSEVMGSEVSSRRSQRAICRRYIRERLAHRSALPSKLGERTPRKFCAYTNVSFVCKMLCLCIFVALRGAKNHNRVHERCHGIRCVDFYYESDRKRIGFARSFPRSYACTHYFRNRIMQAKFATSRPSVHTFRCLYALYDKKRCPTAFFLTSCWF